MTTTNNIFLIGLMGAGKTTIGRILAKQKNMAFYDSDHEIEACTGVKIPLIFELEGEEGFREREIKVIKKLCDMDNIILATGGGAVLKTENQQALKANGTIIYLRGQVSHLWQRTRHDQSRPLLQGGNGKRKLTALYNKRDPIYMALADHVVNTGNQSTAEITETILKKLKQT